ncbi:hypothetical protein HYS00_01095, partial [Candidatus Microgenomates bacterium]|nr:hypothetical protein [Candidatus Microgenomates bacterium]
DYSIWRSEFQGTATTKKADFNTDNKVSLADYSIWRTTFVKGTNPSGAPSPTVVTPTTPVGSCVGGKTTTVKIMPLGDSVTDGTDGRGGYRFKLYNLLKGNNTLFDYVGPNQSGTVPDTDHAGYGGYQVGRVNDTTHGNHMISKEIPTIIPQYAPDVVLFMGGVNDMFGGYENTPWTVDEVGQNVIEAVKQANALRPSATIIVASLTSWGPNDTGDSNRLSINAAIKAGIATLKAQGKPIVYAESMADQVTNQYTPTDVHPTADGYDKMADVWFSYLNPLLCK